MRPDDAAQPRQPRRSRRAYWTLAALLVGLTAGSFSFTLADDFREPALRAAQLIGGLWLNALKMTVIPLIVALLVVGIATGAKAARGGRIAAWSVALFALVYLASATLGMVGMPVLLGLFPLPASAAEGLRAGLLSLDPQAAPTTVPAIADFFSGVIPPNVVAAAANGDVLQLVIFTLLFALAVTRIPEEQGQVVVAFFRSIGAALLVLIGWVLWLAPLGVLALAFALGAAAGSSAFAGLAHYVLLISILGLLVWAGAYVLATVGGRLPLLAFGKAMIGPQALAISTRSSLACLPAMVRAAGLLGIRERVTDVTLPMAVALFRGTGPAMNVGIAVYIGSWLGIEPHVGQVIAAVLVGAVISYGSVSIPGEATFFSSTAPVAIALGVPLAPLALLVAVEMIPDIFRTVGNVTLDVAAASTVDRRVGGGEDQRPAMARTRSE